MEILNYGFTRRHVERNILFSVSPRVAKHARDKRATCPLSHGYKKMFLLSPESLATSFVADYKVSKLATLGDIERTCVV